MNTFRFVDKYQDGKDADYRWGMVYEQDSPKKSTLIAIGLNPSGKTTPQGDEPKVGRTVKYLQGVAEANGYNRLVIMNVTPIKELKPAGLKDKEDSMNIACQDNINNIIKEIEASRKIGRCDILLCYGERFRKLPDFVREEFKHLWDNSALGTCYCLGICGNEEKGYFPCHLLARINKEFKPVLVNKEKVGEVQL